MRHMMLGLLAALTVAFGQARLAAGDPPLPRFTEEREAAALHFIKKHAPDIVPLLEGLKKNNLPQYQTEIREVFKVTEMLAELQEDEPRRHDLELKIWIAESKAFSLVAKLSTPSADDRKKVDQQLVDLAKELVELDIQVLELKSDQLDKELGEIKDELARAREHVDKNAKARYDGLISQVRQKKK
jgi:hypothetical protein